MALIKCPECGKEISDTVSNCIHCGYTVAKLADNADIKTTNNYYSSENLKEPKLQLQPKKKDVGCLTSFAIVAGVVVIILIIIGIAGSKSGKSFDDGENMALVMSHKFVKDKLKSPATAEFASLDESTVKIIDNIYTVGSFVDSENSFGANVRTKYICIMQHDKGSDNWHLENLQFSE